MIKCNSPAMENKIRELIDDGIASLEYEAQSGVMDEQVARELAALTRLRTKIEIIRAINGFDATRH